jgi:6-phosphogluconolactonase
MSDRSAIDATSVVWHVSAEPSAWVAGVIDALQGALVDALAQADRTLLLLSGGNTPAPVYRALSKIPIEWSRVIVSLVDERDVESSSPGSNAKLLRETVLDGPAAAATFWPLREPATTRDAAVQMATQRWTDAMPIVAAAVLGMGDDGHTASLFPAAQDLDRALAERAPYTSIDARGCGGAGIWPRRISLTPSGLSQSRTRLLLLRGAAKREIFERALTTADVRSAPVRIAVDTPGARLHVHWCAT